MARMPAAEHEIDAGIVAGLLADQHPDLAGRPLRLVANGWDNVTFRLGDRLAVRLPRRAAASELIANEQRWLPVLGRELPVPVPVPVRVGGPGRGYPWAWSVVPWLAGRPWELAPPEHVDSAAVGLGAFLAALHRPSPRDAPRNPFRGVPLAERSERLAAGLAALRDRVDRDRCTDLFLEAVSAGPAPDPPVWLHGDLHPLNVLVHDGRLSAVIDFGDLCGGDRATDLAVAWMALPRRARDALRRAAGASHPIDDETWLRARCWALVLAVAYLAGSDDEPVLAGIGHRTLAAVLDDEP